MDPTKKTVVVKCVPEGEFMNAYFCVPAETEEEILMGSIRISIFMQQPAIQRRWLSLVNDAAMGALQEIFGLTPDQITRTGTVSEVETSK